MDPEILTLPLIGRAASVRTESVNPQTRTIEIVWTTGATVQRQRWEGWSDVVEYDEELVVSPNAVRMGRMNDGAPFLDSHNGWSLGSVLGSVVPGSARIEGGEGTATIQLTAAADVADLVQRILEKSVRFVSVGYRVHRYEITKIEGQRELWRAIDWEPMEVSAVAMPADAGAIIRSDPAIQTRLAPCIVQGRVQPSPANRAANPKGTHMDPETLAAAAAAEAIATTPANPGSDQIEAVRAEERRRTADILTLSQRHGLPADFSGDLIARGVSLDAARGAILDRLAAQNPTTRGAETVPAQAGGPSATDLSFRDAVTAALMHRYAPAQHPMDGNAREFRGMTLMEMARATMERRGVNTRGMSKMELAGLALTLRADTGFHSTSDFPSILANIANKTLRQGYESTPRTFTSWARQVSIPDFKQVQRTQLGGAPDLVKVPESGEFTYGTIGEGKEVYSLATYGRIIGITRQTIINDDLNAFARIPAAFGASAADLESDLVYSILTGNPVMNDAIALFNLATHGNVGTAGIISETSLTEAYELYAKQKGLEGRLISIQPRFIIVPPGTRAVEARKNITQTTPAAVAGVNAFANRLEIIEEARLLPASGAKPWFLSADPTRIDTVEFGYLEGNNGVYSETRNGFEVDGIEIKARHDFAYKAIDWRGLFQNVGV